MRLRVAIVVVLLAVLSSAVISDVALNDPSTRPQVIDPKRERQLLEQRFPWMEYKQDVPRIDAIRNHLQRLEKFRESDLEGFRLKLLYNCQLTNSFQSYSDGLLRLGKISKGEHLSRISYVLTQREQCHVRNRRLSPLWRIYDDYLRRYQDAVKEAQREFSRCRSQTKCRLGKN